MFAPREAIDPIILRGLIVHEPLQVVYRVQDTPPAEYIFVRVLGHVNVISHHKPDLLQGFLREFASTLIGKTACSKAVATV